MKSAYSPQEKGTIVGRYINGEAVPPITDQTGVPRSTVYVWTKLYQDEHCSKEVSAKTSVYWRTKSSGWRDSLKLYSKWIAP